MPLPPAHLDTLDQHMRVHRQRIAELRQLLETLKREITLREAGEGSDPNPKPEGIPGLVAELELVEREIRKHEDLLTLGQDERLLNALGELLDNPKLARAASRDPRGYARERGAELPPNMDVTLSLRDDQIEMLIAYYDELAPFLLTWNNDGFSPPPGEQEPAPQPAGDVHS
jgi:hypothetical protein